MAIYKENIIDINLNAGNIYRSFLSQAIGMKDQKADHFGVRVFRDGEPVNLTGVSVQGVFMPPQGSPIAITSGNIVSGNVAAVVLPQACYNYDGQFCLAIKLVDSSNSITGTVRIVDGVVDNTHASGTVAPTSAVPTYQEVLSAYEQAITVISKSVRYDTDQSLTDAQKTTARGNIEAASEDDVTDLKSAIKLIGIEIENGVVYAGPSATSNANFKATSKLPCLPGTTITVSGCLLDNQYFPAIVFYKANGSLSGSDGLNAGGESITSTVPSSAVSFRINAKKASTIEVSYDVVDYTKNIVKLNNLNGISLNVSKTIIFPSTLPDWNDAEVNTIYTVNIAASASTLPTHYPTSEVIKGVGLLITMDSNSIVTQVYYSIQQAKAWSRYYANNTWSAWMQDNDVFYKNIKDDTNLLTGAYTANGGSISGNTVTCSAVYQGIKTSEFIPSTNRLSVKGRATFTVPKCRLCLQHYTTSWQTDTIISELRSGEYFSCDINLTNYTGSKYCLLVQSTSKSGVSDYSGMITANSFYAGDYNSVNKSEYYDGEFNNMMEKVFTGIDLARYGNVYTCKKDGSGDFTKLVDAVNYATQFMDSVVYIGEGEFNVIEEFGSTYMQGVDSHNNWGLELKNRIHLIGTSKTVIKAFNDVSSVTNWDQLDWSDDSNLPQPAIICKYFAIFNAGQHGFTIENLQMEDDYIRYTVHDDRGTAGPTPYHNRYINCSFKHTHGMYPDCIGAGIGEDGYIEIRGCYFDGDTTRGGNPVTRYVYWHGNNNSSVTNAKGKIFLTDNYFCKTGAFHLMRYGYSATKTIAYMSNNSFGSEPTIMNPPNPNTHYEDNMEMVKWNNIVRT